MNKWKDIALSLVALVAILVGTAVWTLQLYESVTYRPTLLTTQPPPGTASKPLAEHLVFIVIDGLRYDVSKKMPYLNELRRQSAQASVVVPMTSFSQPAWTTLVSGAPPDINGASPLNAPTEDVQPIAVDDLFAEAHRAGLTSAVTGHVWWEKMVPAKYRAPGLFVSGEDDAADREVMAAAKKLLAEKPNLLLVHLDQVDHAGHESGGTSQAYLDAALRVDGYLRDLVAMIDLTRDAVVIVADHGHIDQGGHGGPDPMVVKAPFVALGRGVAPGDYGTIAQEDIAPTLATLLGVAIPSAAQGTIRFEMLNLSEPTRAERAVALAQQRVELAKVYLASIGAVNPSDGAAADLKTAQGSLSVGDYTAAFNLARLSVQQANQDIATARADGIAREELMRLVIAIIAALIPAWLFWRVRSRRVLMCLLAAAVAIIVYNALFVLQGNVYSLSGIPGLMLLVTGTATRMLVALLVGLAMVLIWLWSLGVSSLREVTSATYLFGLSVAYELGLIVMACFVFVGFRIGWYMPDLTAAFLEFATLLQILIAAPLSILLPIVAVPVYALLRRLVPRRAARRA